MGSSEGELKRPQGLAADTECNIYVGDFDNNRIQKFDSSGKFLRKWGGMFIYSDSQQSISPGFFAIDTDGYIYVTNTSGNNVLKFNSGLKLICKWGKTGKEDGQFSAPSGIAVDNHGDIWVADSGNNRVQKFKSDGTFISKFSSNSVGEGSLSYTNGMVIDSKGYLYFTKTFYSSIYKFSMNGSCPLANLKNYLKFHNYFYDSQTIPSHFCVSGNMYLNLIDNFIYQYVNGNWVKVLE